MRLCVREHMVNCIRKGFICLLVLLPLTLPAQSIDKPVSYVAHDSLVLTHNGVAHLHGESQVTYGTIQLNSSYIRVTMDSSLVYAIGTYDSTKEEWIGRPVFKDGGDEYESDQLTYNLTTQKGYIRNVVTQQGEGYIISDKTKKLKNNEMLMADGKYTTCDNHNHPHFHLQLTKAKVHPGEYIAAGPAYLVVGDVPLPLAIPFGFFPFNKTYTSGLIMPTFGDDYRRGLYLQGIGYYFAINDYCDLELKGDIYSKGTWAVYGNMRYLKRYKFNGNFNLTFRQDVEGERDLPNYSKSTNFNVHWTHTQDSKANPYCNFSASVDFSTSGYNRSNINNYYNPAVASQNTKASSISYTQRFPDSPWSISLTASIQQRTQDSTLSLTAPSLNVSMSRINPFKRKHPVGKERWYEKINMSYTGTGQISVNSIKEKDFLKSNFLRDWRTGLKHSIPISASFMAFKYISISPSINLTDRMYFTRTDQRWDDVAQQVVSDTTTGFYNVFDFNVGVSVSTKLYGMFTPMKKLFPNTKVEAFRHVLTPNISFSYHPDFGKPGWGYYGSYDQPVLTKEIDPNTGRFLPQLDENGEPILVHQSYSRYQGALYGNASNGASGTLSFSLANNLEMKLKNVKDTTGKEPFKVYSIIDNLSINGGYNFIADSMNWSNFSVNLRLKIPKVNYTLNLSTSLDPYMYEYNALGTPVRTNKQYWSNGRFPHWSGTSISLSYTFSNQVIQKWKDALNKKAGKKSGDNNNTSKGENEDGDMNPTRVGSDGTLANANRGGKPGEVGEDGYVRTKFPWSLSISYTMNYGDKAHTKDNFDERRMQYKMGLTHTLNFSGSLGLGDGWKVTGSASYDFKYKKLSSASFNVVRDLHCWTMTCSFVPFGVYKSYNFHIGVNASMLADLKYDKSSADATQKLINWW